VVDGVDTFMEMLQKGARILDVGCGTGIKTAVLMGKGFSVTGVDFSEKMIEIARRNVPEAKFEVWDLMDLGKMEQKFDAVFAQAVLLHIPKRDIPAALRILAGRLVPGGYLYVAVKERRTNEGEEEVVKENDYGYEYERFFSYFTLEDAKNFIKDAGLAIRYESVTSSGRRNWIQIIGQCGHSQENR